jgi:hypothetical protein
MHDDQTRVMGQPDGGHGNMRLLVAGLIAVIVGLVIAIVVIAGGDGDNDTVSTPSEITTLPTTTGGTTTEPTTTTDTTAPTTTETTAPTTETEPTTPTEEDGSGGIEVP